MNNIGTTSSTSLEEIFRVKLGPLQVYPYGQWNKIDGIFGVENIFIWEKRKDALKDVVFDVAVEYAYPNSIIHLVQ